MTDLTAGVSERKRLPQTSYDRLRAACTDILLWDHIDPDCWLEYEPIADDKYWQPVERLNGR